MKTLSRRHVIAGLSLAATAACAGSRSAHKDADVIVVGAGLSGLFAATLLSDAGLRTIVLERAQRIGGRIWTLDDLPGRPEAGGEQVGQTYARIRYAAERVSVPIIEPRSTESLGRTYVVGNKLIDATDIADAPENQLPPEYRRAGPDGALFAAAAAGNPLDWPGAWRESAALERDIAASQYLRNRGFSEDALRQVNIALNANDLDTYSMLNVWRSLTLFAMDRQIGASGAIEGGSQRLPEALAAQLPDVRLNATVLSVEQTDGKVAVSVGRDRLYADHCILALPFPALRSIALDPAPYGAQAAAIASLPYTQILQLHLLPEMKFWADDGFAPQMWTDGPLERIFAVRDSENGEIATLRAWINGDAARVLAIQDDAALERLAQSEFKRIRPASDGRVRLLKAVRWTEQSYAGGAYMHWAPGQATLWAKAMVKQLGRIHFAGEHLSYLHTGMEGAMESGERAATDILDMI